MDSCVFNGYVTSGGINDSLTWTDDNVLVGLTNDCVQVK